MSHPLRTIAQWAMDKQRAETDRTKRLRSTGIPSEYWDRDWSSYDTASGTAEETLHEILTDYVEHWTPDEHMGLVLLGPPGFGKTLGMLMLGVSLATERGAWVKYTTEAALYNQRNALIGLEKQAEQADDWGDYNRAAYQLAFIERECDVLLLDDVGKAYRAASDYSSNQLDLLLRSRREAGKVTCITSNLLHKDWVAFDASMASFLYDVGEIIQVTRGKDYRARRSPAQERRRAGR